MAICQGVGREGTFWSRRPLPLRCPRIGDRCFPRTLSVHDRRWCPAQMVSPMELVGANTLFQEKSSQTSDHRRKGTVSGRLQYLSLIHISEPTRLGMISYAVFC